MRQGDKVEIKTRTFMDEPVIIVADYITTADKGFYANQYLVAWEQGNTYYGRLITMMCLNDDLVCKFLKDTKYKKYEYIHPDIFDYNPMFTIIERQLDRFSILGDE